MWSSFICSLYSFFNTNVLLHVTHTHVYSFSWGFWQLWFPELHLHHLISDFWFLFTFFCHLVAHQHLTWAHYLLPWPFQNYLSYCGLQISVSISLFIIRSALLTTLFSLSFSTSSFVLHSKQFDSHTSQMWLSSSFLFLKILPQEF